MGPAVPRGDLAGGVKFLSVTLPVADGSNSTWQPLSTQMAGKRGAVKAARCEHDRPFGYAVV